MTITGDSLSRDSDGHGLRHLGRRVDRGRLHLLLRDGKSRGENNARPREQNH